MNIFIEVFSKKRYAFLFLLLNIVSIYGIIWINNLQTLRSFFSVADGIGKKLVFLFSMIGSLGTNFSPFSLITTLLLVVLFALNITLIAFYIRQRKTSGMNLVFGKGLAGFIAGIFGVGCSACGAILIGPLFATLGIGGFLAFLPLHGQEFTLLGIIALFFSIWSLIKQMNVFVCEIE